MIKLRVYRCPSERRRKCHLPMEPRSCDISQSKGFRHLKRTKKKKKIQQEETNAITKTHTRTTPGRARHKQQSPFRHRRRAGPRVRERPLPLGVQTGRRAGQHRDGTPGERKQRGEGAAPPSSLHSTRSLQSSRSGLRGRAARFARAALPAAALFPGPRAPLLVQRVLVGDLLATCVRPGRQIPAGVRPRRWLPAAILRRRGLSPSGRSAPRAPPARSKHGGERWGARTHGLDPGVGGECIHSICA